MFDERWKTKKINKKKNQKKKKNLSKNEFANKTLKDKWIHMYPILNGILPTYKRFVATCKKHSLDVWSFLSI